MWSCPICHQSLQLNERVWRCESNHCFDVAKEGYVNLLPVNKKRSLEPGDSAEMLSARRETHQQGLYLPLAEKLAETISSISPTKLLDIGCGEGYYSGVIKQALPNLSIQGIDISKPAVRLAAKAYKESYYAVASSFHLPLNDNSVDLALRVFAPSDSDEIARVLTENGSFIVVTPAAQHLKEVRAALYDEVVLHDDSADQQSGFKLISKEALNYQQSLDNKQLVNLIAMTPFAHKGHREKREQLLKSEHLTLTFSFNISRYQQD